MKKREGFVANSSSASYTITIQTDKDSFFNNLVEHVSYPHRGSFREKVVKHIDSMKGYLKDKTSFPHMKENYLGEIKRHTALLEKLDSLDMRENDGDRIHFYELVFNFHNIVWEKTKENHIMISEFTSMHNDFNEGMSLLFKEIIFSFMFETNIPVLAEVAHD